MSIATSIGLGATRGARLRPCPAPPSGAAGQGPSLATSSEVLLYSATPAQRADAVDEQNLWAKSMGCFWNRSFTVCSTLSPVSETHLHQVLVVLQRSATGTS